MRSATRFVWLAALAALFAGAGCAYFNTFYFAEKWYGDAERSRARSESDKIPPDALQKYDDAIKQCLKVVRDHPGSRWADDALFLMGASFYGKREYEKALDTLDDVEISYPRSEFLARSQYVIGLCHFERRNDAEMQSAFTRALSIDPEFDGKDDILFTLAKAAERSRNRPEAVRRYRGLVRAFPGSDRADEALLQIGDLYFDAARYDSAAANYEELGRVTHNDKFYRESLCKLAEALIRLDRPDEALGILRPFAPEDDKPARGVVDDFPARVRILQARADNSLGLHESALARLRKAAELYPASTYAAEAQFQIGYTYEVFMDSLDAAKAAYDQAAKGSAKSAFREQAQVRANNLNALKALSSQVGDAANADREDRALAKLKMAEVYLFSQDREDDAMAGYREIVRDFPETRAAPRAAYGIAWIQLRNIEGTRDSALTRFRDLIERWPDTKAAHAALDLLIAEKADTAGLRGLLKDTPPESIATAPAPADTARGLGLSPRAGAPDSVETEEGILGARGRPRGARVPYAPKGTAPLAGPGAFPAPNDSLPFGAVPRDSAAFDSVAP